ncbi:hypothetical protein L0V05_01115 [Tabrizicola sp. J26]|uniref:hypothetical protein n=1 Tax=Alitabrizicola rongguiensis TaxID=2909234 RepID=UPI001F1B5DDF|nr:hypothetical protein [Tabrizicola rongguiensis]MCF1707406.1 hypothetical protein [Tabrizicola rongguiensis]
MRASVGAVAGLGLLLVTGCSQPLAPDAGGALPPPGAASLSAPPAGTNTAANYAQDIKADPSMQEACRTGVMGRCP